MASTAAPTNGQRESGGTSSPAPGQIEASKGSATVPPGREDQPFLIENSPFNLFVIQQFLSLKAKFPVWYHNTLLTHLSVVYCPHNWARLTQEEREAMRTLSNLAAMHAAEGHKVNFELREGDDGSFQLALVNSTHIGVKEDAKQAADVKG